MANYLEMVDGIRDQLPNVRQFVALGGAREGWLDYEELVAGASAAYTQATIDERDLLTHQLPPADTTSRPKGVIDYPPQRVYERRGHPGPLAYDPG